MDEKIVMQMEPGFNKNNTLALLNHFLYFFFFIGLIFSFRAITSISIGLIFLTGLFTNRALVTSFFQRTPLNYFMAGSVLFFLLQVISLLYTQNRQEGWSNIRLQAGLPIIPLAIYCSGYLNAQTVKRLFFEFCILLAIASLYCLSVQFFRFLHSSDTALFFYHQLVSPLKQHAVYFSIFVFVALIYLLESIRKKDFLVNKAFYISFAFFFAFFLFLLSSKLVIFFFTGCLLYYFIVHFIKKGVQKIISLGLLIVFVIVAGLVVSTHNPISNRFSEIFKSDIDVVKQDQYKPADYFNGLQFRMLQWKLVPEILTEKNAWLAGVGGGDAQLCLNEKYISKNMYVGDPQQNDKGFLGYNSHNQFLQSLLENGIIGLLIFLFICISLVRMAMLQKRTATLFIISLLLVYALTESVFKTQYGIIIFTFFPLLAFLGESPQNRG